MQINLSRLKSLEGQYIDNNLLLINEFLRLTDDAGIEIIIVEGSYNPLAYSKKNLTLNRRVKQRLAALADQYPRVRFITRESQYELKTTDFRDGYHVKKSAGLAFTRDLLRGLES
jgi:hypothetical protein